MIFTLHAACGCNIGNVRKNNEDNFYFNNECLDTLNNGLSNVIEFEGIVKKGLTFAIFDGMGGENFGEVASFSAASCLKNLKRSFSSYLSPEKEYISFLNEQLDIAVKKEKKKLCTDKMGTTVAGIYFGSNRIYSYNVGDSRVYQFRDNNLYQLSWDHIENHSINNKKSPLTQFLGYDSDGLKISPYIATDLLKNNDLYLICSDGITDMLTDLEISDIMRKSSNSKTCVESLINSALEHGGRDNITAIVCRLQKLI